MHVREAEARPQIG